MGQQKKRGQLLKDKVSDTEEFIRLYQFSLRALISSLPSDVKDSLHPDIAAVGRSEIWPCLDGAVILIYHDPSREIELVVKPILSKRMREFISQDDSFRLFNSQGDEFPFPPSQMPTAALIAGNGNDLKRVVHGAELHVINQVTGEIYKSRFHRLMAIGWDTDLPSPDQLALEDFQSAFIDRNLDRATSGQSPPEHDAGLTKAKAENLLNDFRALLDSACKEESLQVFLEDYPELIYPDYIECLPKFKMGEDYVSDYVFSVESGQGKEYVFVEIEKADKPIFVKSGQFTSEFTQAKNQLLDWDNWLTRNHAYASRKLCGLYKPQYHLIMGRDKDMSNEEKEKLQSEFSGTSRRFSTYDDIARRFEQIISRLINR